MPDMPIRPRPRRDTLGPPRPRVVDSISSLHLLRRPGAPGRRALRHSGVGRTRLLTWLPGYLVTWLHIIRRIDPLACHVGDQYPGVGNLARRPGQRVAIEDDQVCQPARLDGTGHVVQVIHVGRPDG